jgi:hypothetical protein
VAGALQDLLRSKLGDAFVSETAMTQPKASCDGSLAWQRYA